MNIRTKFMLSFLFIAGIALSAIAFISYNHACNQLEYSVDQEMTLKVGAYVDQWNGWLSSKAAIVSTTQRTIQNTVGDGPINKSYLQGFSGDGELQDIFIGFNDGTFLDGGDWVPPPGYTTLKRSWYVEGAKREGLSFSAPYVDLITDTYVISLLVPLKYSDGRLRGLVGGDLSLETLTNEVKTIKVRGAGDAFLIDQNGTILAHPRDGMISTNLKDNASMSGIAGKVLSKQTGILHYQKDGESQLLTYRRIPLTGWILCFTIPESIAYSELSNLQNQSLAVSGLILIAVIIFALGAAESLTRPIKMAVHHADTVARGELTAALPGDMLQRKDETGMLGRALQEMTQNILSMIEEIRESEEATAALNIQLKAVLEEKQELLGLVGESYMQIVQALGNAIEAKDKYTRGHCDRVTRYALDIARDMGIEDRELNALEVAGRLHDIGKIGIPIEIINKLGPLTPDEFQVMTTHPAIGSDILRGIRLLKRSRKVIHQHHEQVNGQGYPQGLKEDDIDILARILSVADAYDAMTSSRPYRLNPLEPEQAMGQLLLNADKQFYRPVVEVFIRTLHSAN